MFKGFWCLRLLALEPRSLERTFYRCANTAVLSSGLGHIRALLEPSFNSFTSNMASRHFRIPSHGSCLVVQWLGLHTSTARDTGSISGQGTKIAQATWQKKKKKKSQARQPTTWPRKQISSLLFCTGHHVCPTCSITIFLTLNSSYCMAS